VTAKLLYVARGVAVSHEFVRREERDLGSAEVLAPAGVGTGVYVCDEQYLKVRGREMFRHAVVDAAATVIAEAVRPDKEEATIAAFWTRAFEGRPLTAIVTDMDKKYEPALDAVVRARFPVLQMGAPRPVLHQFCTFHAQRWFAHECREAEASARRKEGGRKTSYDVERSLLRLAFCLDRPKQVAVVRSSLPADHGPWVDRLLARIAAHEITPREASRDVLAFLWRGRWAFARRVVKVLESYRAKWDDLTHFYDHPEIPRTSNAAEGLFSRTNPERVKRRFRTAAGITAHLSAKYAARRTIQALLAEQKSLTM
jgi:hypothetical protein